MAKKEGQLALNAKPAQEAYANVAKAISKFTPVTMLVDKEQLNTAA